MKHKVILVDEHDREIGEAEKIEAHQNAWLHRAFSIFIFNTQGSLLLQRRASGKYHSGSLWTNTCCSHPQPGSTLFQEAHRKLQLEMGFDCDIHEVFTFTYRVELENGLSEHEIDHVFVGVHDGDPVPNPEEVEDWRWAGQDELKADLLAHPERYSYWMKLVFDRVLQSVDMR